MQKKNLLKEQPSLFQQNKIYRDLFCEHEIYFTIGNSIYFSQFS
jgi:hypothetical protein